MDNILRRGKSKAHQNKKNDKIFFKIKFSNRVGVSEHECIKGKARTARELRAEKIRWW
jgi:hypothetical protein